MLRFWAARGLTTLNVAKFFSLGLDNMTPLQKKINKEYQLKKIETVLGNLNYKSLELWTEE